MNLEDVDAMALMGAVDPLEAQLSELGNSSDASDNRS